jgi:hypothetical protein
LQVEAEQRLTVPIPGPRLQKGTSAVKIVIAGNSTEELSSSLQEIKTRNPSLKLGDIALLGGMGEIVTAIFEYGPILIDVVKAFFKSGGPKEIELTVSRGKLHLRTEGLNEQAIIRLVELMAEFDQTKGQKTDA